MSTPRLIHGYVTATSAIAVLILLQLDWNGVLELSGPHLVGLLSLTALGLFSEASAFSYKFQGSAGSSSLVFLPLVAAAILFGIPGAVAFIVVTATVAEFGIRRKPWLKAVFNVAQYVNATAAAGWVFEFTGGIPLALVADGVPFDAQVLPVIAFGGVALALNHLAVAGAIAASKPGEFVNELRTALNHLGQTVPSDLLVLPVSILVAYLYFELGVIGLFVALLPLTFVRVSYIEKYRLAAANLDLLQALVIAIETRDPYTSGHSKRVQELAVRIGSALGLTKKQLGELEMAALLHDIGKIEVGYEEILQKSGKLTSEERLLIESHVHRGAEILTQLSSFNDRVIAAVRHHHELFDGSGYPDGLEGDEVPLYARVIKVADAIDAMLSSRPYRDALSPGRVEAELERYSGRHFDPKVAKVVLERGIVRSHQDDLSIDRVVRRSKGLRLRLRDSSSFGERSNVEVAKGT